MQAFIERLLYAASQEEVPIYVIVTMRSDFLGHCAALKGLTEAINRSQYLTPTLTRDQCRKAIERPVRLFGGGIEPILVNRLLNDLGSDVDQMPILQHALMRLWTVACTDAGCQPPVRIGLSHYERIGKLKEALSVHAEEIYHALDDRQKQIAEVLFRNLITMVDDHHVRKPARLGRVAEVAEASVNEVKAVIDVFREDGRSFLMPEREVALSADSMIDISHESLVRQWSRLRAWAEAKANSEKVAGYFAQSADLWDSKGRDPGFLLPNDVRLVAVTEWREQSADELSPMQQAFLDASLRRRDQELFRQREAEFLQRLADDSQARVEAIRENKPHVFVGFMPQDRELVARVRRELEESGRIVAWSDWDQVPPGPAYLEEIYKSIEGADALLIVLSPESAGFHLVQVAVKHALAGGKRVIPVVARDLGDTPVPDELKPLNWIFFRPGDDFRRAVRVLGDAIESELYWVRMHTRLLVRATDWDHRNRDPDLLLRGNDLDEADRWLAQDLINRQAQVTPLQRQYVRESFKYRSRRDKRRQIGAIAGLLVAILVLSLVTWAYLDRTRNLKKLEETSGKLQALIEKMWETSTELRVSKLAAESRAIVDSQPQRGLLLAMEAIERMEMLEKTRPNERHPNVAAVYSAMHRALTANDGIGLPGLGSPITAVAIHPEAGTLAVCDAAGNLQLWDVKKGLPRAKVGDQGENRPSIHRDILGAVRLATFSPDGRWLITAGTRGDTGQGAAQRDKTATLEGSTDRIDELVRLWHWGSGGFNPKDRLELDPQGPISDLQVSPDGRWLAVLSYPGRGRLYDLQAPDPVSHPVVLHTHLKDLPQVKDLPQDVAAIAFAPDSRLMAVTGQRGLVVIWDLDRPRPAIVDHVVLRRTGQGASGHAAGPGGTPERSHLTVAESTEEGDVELALVRAFTPDGDLVVTHGLSGDIMIVGRQGEGAQSHWKVHHQVSHGGPISVLTVSADSRWLVTGGQDCTVHVWNLREKDWFRRNVVLRDHTGPITQMAVSQDQRWLFTAGMDYLVNRYDLNMVAGSSYARPNTIRGADGPITSLAIDPSGRLLATAGQGGTGRFIKLDSTPYAEPFVVSLDQLFEDVSTATVSPDGKCLVALGTAGSYARWDLSKPTPTLVHGTISDLEGTIDGASLSNDGRRLAFYTNTGEVGFADLRHDATYMCVKQPDGDAPATKLVSITLSPDGRRLVTLDLFGQAHLWDLDTKPSDRHPVSLVSGDRPVSAVAFSDDNRRLAIGDVRGAVRIWDPVAGRELARWDTAFAGPVTALELDRSGKRLVAAGNRIVKIWDLTPGGATFSAERTIAIPTIGVITGLTLCGDETNPADDDDDCYLAIAGDDNTVRVRQVRDLLAKATDDAFTVPHLVTLSGHQGPILEIAFDPRARLVSVSLDGTARRWTIRPKELKEIARLKAGRNLTREEWALYFGDESYRRTFPELGEPPHFAGREPSPGNWRLKSEYLGLPIQAY